MFLLYIDWLEEIGLPQYRGSFLEARVDGHVLNLLTIVSSNILTLWKRLLHIILYAVGTRNPKVDCMF